MTFYSDLLTVITELEALQHGQQTTKSVAELRSLCTGILAIDPEEFLAHELLALLDAQSNTATQRPLGDEDSGNSKWHMQATRLQAFALALKSAFWRGRIAGRGSATKTGTASFPIFSKPDARSNDRPDIVLAEVLIYLSSDTIWGTNCAPSVGMVEEELRQALYQGRLTAWGKVRAADMNDLQVTASAWDQHAELNLNTNCASFRAHDLQIHNVRLSRRELERQYPPLD